MSALTDSARGEDCTLVLPRICNRNPETTVLAHVRTPGVGYGIKPADWFGVYACSACHDALDGRVNIDSAQREVLQRSLPTALYRTMGRMFDKGLIAETSK